MTLDQQNYERIVELEKVVSELCSLLKTRPEKLVERVVGLQRELEEIEKRLEFESSLVQHYSEVVYPA